jgi:hypothetical protein
MLACSSLELWTRQRLGVFAGAKFLNNVILAKYKVLGLALGICINENTLSD